MHKRLFIPGPVEVDDEILQAMTVPMVGHRMKEYSTLHADTRDKLIRMLKIKEGRVFLLSASGTGGLETALRNLTDRKVLSVTCGAFGERWFSMAEENGKAADHLPVEWGMANRPEAVEAKVKAGDYDLVTVTHNETSTGVMNPIADIGAALKSHPDTLLAVDAVSSMAGVPIYPEEIGVDLLLAGVQKAFGIPPGLCVVYVSPRALERAKKVKNRGHYFDLLSLAKKDEVAQTPETPCITLVHALGVQLQRFFDEGLDNRWARHQKMAERCRAWAREKFEMFPEEGFESVTMSCIRNTRNIDVKKLNAALAEKGVVIGNGYGKLKDKTFRIAHMADIQPGQLEELLGWIDEAL